MKHAFVVIGIAMLVTLPALAQEPRHLFHASAFAVQGSADGRQIASDATVVLPESGGSLSRRVENYDDGIVRYANATAEVTGVERDGVAFTTSTVTIRDLDIMNIVHADSIVLRATSRQAVGDAEGSISYAGSRLDGLKVRGEPVELAIDTERFNRAPTFAALRNKIRSDCDDTAIERYGSISDSIVRSINLASLGTVNGYALPIDGVGTLYLGHVTATPGERRVAMIRLDLGRRGLVVVGLDDVNGEPVP